MRRIYYASSTGSDMNDGLSPENPIRTIKAAMQKGFSSGNDLRLVAGSVFEETIILDGLDDVSVGLYGTGQAVIKPKNGNGMEVRNSKNISVFGIKFIGQGWEICNESKGIDIKDSMHVRLENLEATGFHKFGINITTCEHVDVLGCYAHENGLAGIHTHGEKDENARRCKHIRIAHCKANDNPGDWTVMRNHSGNGIVLSGTHHGVVEFCEAAGNGWGQRQHYVNGPVGMWACCGCYDVVFRYCIGRHNRTQPGAVDGDGFDIDGEVENGVIEYCYSYGNEGAGYLYCEFWGDHSGKNWRNNHNRYSVSFADDTRIGDYGALAISSPYEVPMEKLYVHRNFFCANKSAAIYNRDLKPQVKDIHITENVLITGGEEAITNKTGHALIVENNTEIRDTTVQAEVLKHAPEITNPRQLKNLPIFEMLENGTCAKAIREGRYEDLFKTNPPVIARSATTKQSSLDCFASLNDLKLTGGTSSSDGFRHTTVFPTLPGHRLFELRLYDMDLEGCVQSGDVRLSYDSIKPGISTRLKGAGSEVSTPIPWWADRRRLVVRVSARLTSPDTVACLFLRHENGKPEERVYLHGNVSEYHITTLSFLPEDKWDDPGKIVGVRIESGTGAVLVHSIEVQELPKNAEWADPSESELCLDDFRQFGDVYEEDGKLILGGQGAGLVRLGNIGNSDALLSRIQGEGFVQLNNNFQLYS